MLVIGYDGRQGSTTVFLDGFLVEGQAYACVACILARASKKVPRGSVLR